MVFQELLGIKRAAYHMCMSKDIDAKTALEWGLVNEVVPRENLVGRAWEIVETVMKQDRVVRRMTSQLTRRPLKRLLVNDFQTRIGHEFYASHVPKKRPEGVFDSIRESWKGGRRLVDLPQLNLEVIIFAD